MSAKRAFCRARRRLRNHSMSAEQVVDSDIKPEEKGSDCQDGERLQGIPPDFQSAWGISDVALRCSDNRLLHVNKTVMGLFSPYFNVLLFGEFAEKDKDVVDVDIEYEYMLEILRILHHVDRKYGKNGHELYSPKVLTNLYRYADKFDIPLIRALVMDQLGDTKLNEALEVAVNLELAEEKAAIIKRMSKQDVVTLLTTANDDTPLCLKDLKEMMGKFSISELPEQPENTAPQDAASAKPLKFDQFLRKQPITSLSHFPILGTFSLPWKASDATLQITTGDGKQLLHVNKAVLATFSPFFNALFFGDSADKLQNVVDIDADYEVMTEILNVLFHIKRKFGLSNHNLYDADMLKKMYNVGKLLEIEVVEELCKQQMLEVDSVEGLVLAINFDCDNEKAKILEKMTCSEIAKFFHSNATHQGAIFSGQEVNDILCKVQLGFVDKVSCPTCRSSNQSRPQKLITAAPDTPFVSLYCTYCKKAFNLV